MNFARHIDRFFRPSYYLAPCGDVYSRVNIGIITITTIGAFEVFPFSIPNTFALRAGFRSIGRRYQGNLNPIQSCFVLNESSQLVKRPPIELSFKRFTFWFRSLPNTLKVFYCNSFIELNRFFNNCFRDCVIRNGNKSSFSAAQPFQKLPGASCAFGLNARPSFIVLCSNSLYVARRVPHSVGRCRNISLPKINANETAYIGSARLRNLTCLKQIKLTLPEYEIGLPFFICKQILVITFKGHINSASSRSNGNIGFMIPQNSFIICNAARRRKDSAHRVAYFVCVRDFINGSYNQLRRQLILVFYRIVNFLMQFELCEKLFRESNLGNRISGTINSHQSVLENNTLFRSREKSYLNHQFHSFKILKMLGINEQKALKIYG